MSIALFCLSVVSIIGSLFTVLHLMQTKEWRIDRMREYVLREGTLRNIFGISRPLIVIGFLPLLFLIEVAASVWTLGVLLTISAFNLFAIGLNKQLLPQWTNKAFAMLGVSLALNAVLTFGMLSTERWTPYLAATPFVQPLIVLVSLVLLFPLDFILKRRIIMRAAVLRNQFPSLTVIGITGSVGKTTTKELLKHLLSDKDPLATPRYVNTEMGVASWLLGALPESSSERIMIVEMGAYTKGEIHTLCTIVKPSIGIVTSIGTQHLGLFGSQKNIIDAKGELLQYLPEHGHAFLNADNELSRRLQDKCHSLITFVGTGDSADIRASNVREVHQGLSFHLGEKNCFVPLKGMQNITNVLLAIACAERLNIGRERIAELLETFEPLPHTFAVKQKGTLTILDDTHNASVDSFRAAIAWAKVQDAKHKILLTSGLIELGGAQQKIHTELGKAAKGTFDRVLFAGKRNRSAFQKGYGHHIEDVKTAISVEKSSLVLLVGRLPKKTIRSLTHE